MAKRITYKEFFEDYRLDSVASKIKEKDNKKDSLKNFSNKQNYDFKKIDPIIFDNTKIKSENLKYYLCSTFDMPCNGYGDNDVCKNHKSKCKWQIFGFCSDNCDQAFQCNDYCDDR